MTDILIQATLSNFVVASILAVVAWVVQRQVRSASLSNLLWALVLIKLITPPLVSIPVLEVPSISSSSVLQTELSSAFTPPMGLGIVELGSGSIDSEKALIVTRDATKQSNFAAIGMRNVTVSLIVWLVISGILFVISAFRIFRFHWLLKATSSVHDNLSNGLSIEVAKQLGIRVHPNILVTRANIAPFVWWKAGRSVIVVPIQAAQELSDDDLRLVITHEMAHIKRRDHWFRWLEWLALIGLWWNPVMWWARHQMRISEEMACDDLVLETVAPEVHRYGNALLNMVELLTAAAIRPPVVASAINSGGCLEQRLKMMISDKTRKVPTSIRIAIVVIATCVFPLGVVYAQDLEGIKRRLGGAIEAGELSPDQADLMMEALRHPSQLSDKEAVERRVMRIKEELKEAVEPGKISKEDAEKGDNTESILTRIGLRATKRKDIEAARADFAAADAQFEAARALPVEERAEAFRAAAERYKLAADNWKSSGLEQDALLRAAESHFFAEDYYAAERQYAKLIKEYPRNPYLDHIDSRRFEIAEYWLKVDAAKHRPFDILNVSDKKFPWKDTGGHGKRVLEQMRLDNPTGKVSDDATMRLAVEQFRNEKLKEAVEAGKISKQDAEKKLDNVRREMLGPSERGDKK